MIVLYGLTNCDSVKKARRWLEQHHINYRYHDLRAEGLDAERLKVWIETLGWQTLLNTRSTTWRQLPATDKQDLDAARAFDIMLAHPTIIKRPILENGTLVAVGFSVAAFNEIVSYT